MGEALRIEVVAEEELTDAFHARLSSQASSLAQASRCLCLENTMRLLFWPLSPFLLLLDITLGNGFVELFSEHLSGGELRGTGKLLGRSRSGERVQSAHKLRLEPNWIDRA